MKDQISKKDETIKSLNKEIQILQEGMSGMKEMFDDWVEDKQASFYVGGLMSRAMDLEEIDHMRE